MQNKNSNCGAGTFLGVSSGGTVAHTYSSGSTELQWYVEGLPIHYDFVRKLFSTLIFLFLAPASFLWCGVVWATDPQSTLRGCLNNYKNDFACTTT